MAAGKNSSLLVLATLVAVFGVCSAATITVGGSTGWTIPSSASFYPNWASSQTFRVGDVLVFNFPTGAHTVAEVQKPAYDACSTSNTLSPPITAGPANVTLRAAGTHYFICTFPGHCTANQKLAVTVTGSGSSPAPRASPRARRPSPTPAAAPAGVPPTAPAEVPTAGEPTPSAAAGPTTGGAAAQPPASSSPASAAVGLLSLASVAAAALLF